jgi:hypothetical protein
MANNRLYLRDSETGEEIILAIGRMDESDWDWVRSAEEMNAWLEDRDLISVLGSGPTKLVLVSEIQGTPKTGLKPCPCCGSRAEFEYLDWDPETQTGDDGTGRVLCLSCGLQTPTTDSDDAAAKWNRRNGGGHDQAP